MALIQACFEDLHIARYRPGVLHLYKGSELDSLDYQFLELEPPDLPHTTRMKLQNLVQLSLAQKFACNFELVCSYCYGWQ